MHSQNDLCVQPLHIEDIAADLLIGQPLKYATHGTMAGVHEANHASLRILFASSVGGSIELSTAGHTRTNDGLSLAAYVTISDKTNLLASVLKKDYVQCRFVFQLLCVAHSNLKLMEMIIRGLLAEG